MNFRWWWGCAFTRNPKRSAKWFIFSFFARKKKQKKRKTNYLKNFYFFKIIFLSRSEWIRNEKKKKTRMTIWITKWNSIWQHENAKIHLIGKLKRTIISKSGWHIQCSLKQTHKNNNKRKNQWVWERGNDSKQTKEKKIRITSSL